LKNQVYVVAIEKKDGSLGFFRLNEGGRTKATTVGVTADANMARKFEIDTSKLDIIAWMDRLKSSAAKFGNVDSIRVMVFETTLTKVDLDDIEWKTILQRNAVSKLSKIEIEALGLEKFEIERRLAAD
jgi:hypothetical protein